MRCQPTGPLNASLAAVGEAPGEAEDQEGVPFVGWSGKELTRMLADAGIDREDVFLTNVCRDQPLKNDIDLFIHPNKTHPEKKAFDAANKGLKGKERPKFNEADYDWVHFRGKWVRRQVVLDHQALVAELLQVKPKVILALGNIPMWALTGVEGVSKWRGSYLKSDIPGLADSVVIPAYHPAYILRAWTDRYTAVQDFRRAKQATIEPPIRPAYRFILDPSYDTIIATLGSLILQADRGPLRLVTDLEIKRCEIVCYGIAWSKLDAICIPMYKEAFRTEALAETNPLSGEPLTRKVRMGVPAWTPEQATEIWLLTKRLLEHPNVVLCNQNMPFDLTFLFEDVGFWPRVAWDTMIAQHVIFPGEPKGLDYLASLYCQWYVYWKDDGKFWAKPIVFPQLWEYNCVDCVTTYEVWEVQEQVIQALNFTSQMAFQMRLLPQVQQMMFRGVRVDRDAKARVLRELRALVTGLHKDVEYLAGRSLVGPKGGFSHKKLKKFFCTDLGLKPITKKEKGVVKITFDDDALMRMAKADLWLTPVTTRINQIRSYGTAIAACAAKTDRDGRWRCSYNMAGTENYRFSSDTNPMGVGLNLQNLTLGKDIVK